MPQLDGTIRYLPNVKWRILFFLHSFNGSNYFPFQNETIKLKKICFILSAAIRNWWLRYNIAVITSYFNGTIRVSSKMHFPEASELDVFVSFLCFWFHLFNTSVEEKKKKNTRPFILLVLLIFQITIIWSSSFFSVVFCFLFDAMHFKMLEIILLSCVCVCVVAFDKEELNKCCPFYTIDCDLLDCYTVFISFPFFRRWFVFLFSVYVLGEPRASYLSKSTSHIIAHIQLACGR